MNLTNLIQMIMKLVQHNLDDHELVLLDPDEHELVSPNIDDHELVLTDKDDHELVSPDQDDHETCPT